MTFWNGADDVDVDGDAGGGVAYVCRTKMLAAFDVIGVAAFGGEGGVF